MFSLIRKKNVDIIKKISEIFWYSISLFRFKNTLFTNKGWLNKLFIFSWNNIPCEEKTKCYLKSNHIICKLYVKRITEEVMADTCKVEKLGQWVLGFI